MKVYISAMGTNKSVIENQLVNAAGPLTDHLIKLYLFPHSEYVNHWRQEVYGFLSRVPKLKGKNQYPESDFIFDCISVYLDQTEESMHYIAEEYKSHVPERFNSTELESILESYLMWLSDILSESGRAHSSAIYSKLEELGL